MNTNDRSYNCYTRQWWQCQQLYELFEKQNMIEDWTCSKYLQWQEKECNYNRNMDKSNILFKNVEQEYLLEEWIKEWMDKIVYQ